MQILNRYYHMAETVRQPLDAAFACGAAREVSVKGKQQPLEVFPLVRNLR